MNVVWVSVLSVGAALGVVTLFSRAIYHAGRLCGREEGFYQGFSCGYLVARVTVPFVVDGEAE